VLTPDLKEQRVQACANLLEWYETIGTSLDIIITGDEIWMYHCRPKSNWQSVEQRHEDSLTKNKFKT
jgi:enamine deaminase RidA (YjgF/YER057c/UK114 family)